MLRRLITGLAALATLLALLIGLPMLLWQLGGNPLPASVPTWDQVTDMLTTQDNGQVALTVLAWAGWAGWATFALSVLVEIPAQIRGIRAPRLPALHLQQAGARVLVGAVLAALSVGVISSGGAAHATTPTTPSPAPSASTAEAQPAPRAATTSDTTRSGQPVTVKAGDTLSGIAKEHLGAGDQWPKVYEASKATTQPGGAKLTNPDQIRPGWTITIPGKTKPAPSADTRPTTPQPPSASPAPPTTQETPRTAPPVAIPSAPSAERPGTGAAASPLSSGARPPAPTVTVQATIDQQQMVGAGTGLAAATAGGVVVLLAGRRTIQSRRRRAGQRIAMPTSDTNAAVTEQQLRFDANQDPLAPEHLDLAMRTLAHHTAAAGQALPHLTAARIQPHQLELYLPQTKIDLPGPFTRVADGIWSISRDGIDSLLDPEDAAAVPAPYPTLVTLGHDEEDAWVLLHLEQAQALAVTGPSRSPVLTAMLLELMTASWADDLRVTLVDLLPDLADAFGSDRVTHSTDLDQVLTAAEYAAEIHTHALTEAHVDDVGQARSAGVVPDSWTPQLLVLAHEPTPEQHARITALLAAVPRLAIAVLTTGASMSPWALHTTDNDATLDPTGIQLTPQRIDDATYTRLIETFRTTEQPATDGPAWAATLADEPTPDTIPAAAPATHENDEGEAVAAPAQEATETAPAAGVETDQAVGPEQRTEPTDEKDIDEGDRAAAAETVTPIGNATTTLEDGEHPLARVTSPVDPTLPLVRLLGPLEIQGAPGKRPQSPGKATEIIAFLALHPSPTHEPLDAAIWPGKRMTAPQRNVPISTARAWLGTAPDGHPYVSLVDDAGYSLAPDTQVDWWLFQNIVGDDIATTPTTHLHQALKLVDTTPMTMATRSTKNPLRALAWAEADMQEMIQSIADVAHELSTRALLDRDPTTAAWAAAKGLSIEPASELLWRDALRAAWQSGITGRLEAVADQLTDALEPLGGIEADTVDLMTDLLARAHHARQARAS